MTSAGRFWPWGPLGMGLVWQSKAAAQMGSYVHGNTIRKLISPDSSFYIDIVARHDGTFQYFEQQRLSDSEGGGHQPGKVSGIYSTADAAEDAARSEFKL
jgi:hypothetical protein